MEDPQHPAHVRISLELGEFEVSGPEQVQVTAGTYNCYKVDLNIGQSFWVSTDPKHYLVKFEAGGVVGELNSVTLRAPGEGAIYTDTAFGFSVSAPAGWSFDKQDLDKTNRSAITIIDPQGVATSSLSVIETSPATDKETNTVRKAMEENLAEQAKEFKNFKVRPDSWQTLTLAGAPAVSVVGDYISGKDTNVAYHVLSFVATNAVHFDVYLHAADFEAFRPKIDAVINSYKNQ